MEKILIVPHPKLRQISKSISKVTEKEIIVAEKMKEITKMAPGVGLAANQIGILKKIIVINIANPKNDSHITYSLFNPLIKKFSNKKVFMEEGCLSLPEQFAQVERSESILVQYLNEKNELIEQKKDGFEARVIQHEIDHLSGKLFIDYLTSLKRNIILKKIKKLKKTGEI